MSSVQESEENFEETGNALAPEGTEELTDPQALFDEVFSFVS